MRLFNAKVPSVRSRSLDLSEKSGRGLFTFALLFLLMLGGWCQQAYATIGFCAVIANSPTAQSAAAGTNLNYTFNVRDDGNCDLVSTVDNIVITSDTTGGATISSPAGAQYSGISNPSVPFTLTLGPSAGSVSISVNCQLNCDTFSSATYTATATSPTPNLSISKVLTSKSDPDGSGSVTQGDVLTYTVTATNIDPFGLPVNGVTVTDPLTSPNSISCPTLGPGGQCILTGTYTVTATDAGTGSITNTGSATATGFPSAVTSTLVTPVFPTATMTVTKALASNADGDGSGTVTQGDVLTFTVTALNSGNVTLNTVTVNDPLTIPNTKTCGSLAVGASCILSGTYTVTASDVATGSITNTGQANAKQHFAFINDTLVTPVAGSPKLNIQKTLTGNSDPDGSGTVTEGDVLTYTVTVTNAGNIPLTNVHVTDPLTAPNTITCASVAVGNTCVLTGTYTVTAANATAGAINNTGTVTTVELPGPFHSNLSTPVFGSPAMVVTKVLTNNADGDGSGTVTQGDVLTFRVRSHNSGNIPLTNVVVSDPLTTPNSITCASVAVGGNCNLVGTYTVKAADVTAGSISNTGSVTSTEIAGPSTASLNTPVVGSPALIVTKVLTNNADGDGSGTVTQGDVLTFRVRAQNSGNIPLTNVVVSDPLTTPNSITCASVAVGANCNLLGTYTVQAADVTTGSISNTGSVTSTEVAGPSTASLNTPVAGSPKMTVAKTLAGNADGDGSGSVTQGDVLTFRVTATNGGNIPLTNVTVTDPLTTPNSFTCASVAVGATCVLNGTYTVTSTDVTAGSISNTGSATSTQVAGPVNNTLNTPVVGSPKMTVTKTLNGNADGDGSGTVTQGDVLTFRVTAINGGNIPLTNVTVTDPLTTPNSIVCASVPITGACVLNGTYTVTAADVTAGSISNTGSATSTQVAGPVNNTLNTPVLGSPKMTVAKVLAGNADGDGSGTITQGDVLTFRVTATNGGNIPLTNVTVTDPLTTPNSFTCANVAVGATCVLNGTYTVTAADVTAGSISNTGSATSTQVAGPINNTLNTPVVGSPKMTVAKTLAGNADGDGSGTVTQGDALTFRVTATNGGNIPLTNVTVSDPLTTPNSFTCASVAVGATCVLNGTYTVTAADVTAGSISNTGSATSTQVAGPVNNTLNTPVLGSPKMTVAKVLAGNADGDGSGTVTQGDVLTFRVTATNGGNIPLTNVKVNDPLTTPNTITCANVAVGATCVLNGTYTVTAADVTTGSISNTGSATSTQVAGPVNSTLNTPVIGSPKMSVAKTLAGNADGDGSGSVTQGDVLTFRVTATNTGNIPLTNVQVGDALTTPNTITCANVAVGATCVLDGTYTVTAADVTAGNISNTGIGRATQFPGVAFNSTLNTPVVGSPKMTVAKTLTGNADGDGSGTVTQGDVLTYAVTATNGGNIPLTNVKVNDPLTTPNTITCANVAVGATCVLNGTYTVTAADVTAGSISNTGSATSTQVAGPVNSTLNTPVIGSPKMTIAKVLAGNADGDRSGTVTQGDVLTFTVTATNGGNIPLTNVVVSDPLTTPGTTTCASVAVGATCVLSGTYTVTNADVLAGTISNTGTATSTQVAGPLRSTVRTRVFGSPAMNVAKTLTNNADGDGSGSVTQGDVLTYAVTATNTGNIALTNVTVTDPLTTPNTVTCASVAVGGTCVLSGTYTVTAADVKVGSIRNIGSGTSTQVAGPVNSTLTTPVNGTPKMTIAKVLAGNADGDGSRTVTQGDVLTYTVTATNGGNIPLTNVVVNDPLTTPATVTCASVAIGSTCVLSGTYTVTNADVLAGSISNTGTARASQFRAPFSSTLNTHVFSSPAMTLVKAVTNNADGDGSGTVTPGDVLTYTVTATNSGNIPLTNVTVKDPQTAPNSTACANVAVGAACVLTGTYTVTPADANRQSITNTATATATPIPQPMRTTLKTPVFAGTPALTVVKTLTSNADGDRSGTVTQGDVLTYTVTATNSGNVPLTGVHISDPLTAPNAASCANLTVGASCVLTGTYTVSAADVTAGAINNTGSASSNQITTPVSKSLSTPVSGTPSMTVTKTLSHNADGDGSGSVTPGDVLTYTVTATNSGNVALTQVQVTDPITTPGTQSCASVAAGATCVLTGSYTVTAADAAKGSVSNIGSATSNQTAGAVSSTLNTPVFTLSRTIAIASGDGQSGNPGSGLPNPLAVLVENNGNPANGTTVNWAVVSGTATLSNPTSPVNNGQATISVNLGASSGPVTITATRADDTTKSVTFHETINVVAPPVLSLVSGNNQIGVVNADAALPLVVHLVDGSGAPFTGQSVNWQVVSGPASIPAASSGTNGSGNAQMNFTFGASTGPVVIRASFGTSTVDFSANSDSYQITILGGNNQSAAPGQPLPQDFTVVVAYPTGMTTLVRGVHTHAAASLANVPVQWNVTAGGGSLSQGNNTVTNTGGHSTNHYTLGTGTGLNQVQVVVPGGASVTFTANSAFANGSLKIVSGNPQTLTTNTTSAPMVVVLTSNGVPVPNATINWSANNATLGSATSVTDTNGQASNTAKVTNIGAATVSASSTAPVASPVTFGLNGGISQLGGLTPTQGQIAGAVDNACAALAKLATLTPAQQDLLKQCDAISYSAGSNPDQAVNAINQLFSDVAFLQTSAALLISNAQFDNIKARIAALRSGTGGDHFGGLAFSSPSGTLPIGSMGNSLLAVDDTKKDDKKEIGSDFSRWGFFLSGTFSNGSADPRADLPGYGFHTDGVTGGVDYRFNDKLIFGLGAGYAKYDAGLNAGAGGMNTTGWSLSAYSTYFRKDNWYLDGVFTWGSNSYDLTRRILYSLTTSTGTTTVDQTATATDNGTTLSGALTFGRDFSKGPWSFGPYFRGTWTKVDFDGYQENLLPNANGSGLGLAVQTHSLKSTSSVLGAKVNYASSQSWGILMPHAEVEWEHEFQDNPDSVTARFLQDPTQTPITANGFPVDNNFFRLGLGASFIFNHGRSGFIYYEKTLGRSGITEDNIAVGLRLEF